MKKIRFIAFVLAVLTALSCFAVSCGKEDEGEQDIGGEAILNTEEKDTSKILDLEKKDLGGHEFRFISRKVSSVQLVTHEIYAEGLTGDKVNDAVFTRNSQIEKEYNCKILEEQTASPASSTREPLMAGEYVADFLFDEARLLRTLASGSLLADIAKTESINLEKAWWDQNSLAGMNIGGKIFFVVGDAATMDDRASWLVWFNKDHIEEYDSSIDLYQEVRDGKWTVDRMYELSVATAKDLNGDGILMMGEDRMGYIAERYCNFGHVLACGITVGDLDDAGNWMLPMTPKQELLDAWSALKPLLTTPTREVSSNIGRFRQGMGTFYSGNMGIALEVSETTYRLGALPMPKQNEAQKEYYTGVYYSQLCAYAIPNTADNAEDAVTNGFTSGVEQAAYFLEVFSYYSMNLLTPAFFNQVLMKQSVTDVESVEMIEIALENKVYDPIAGYDFGGINIFSLVGSAGKNGITGTDVNYETLVSTYEARVSAARKALQSYIDYISAEDTNIASPTV